MLITGKGPMGLNLRASYTSLMISIVQMRTLRFLSALRLDSAIPLLSSEVLTKVSDNKEPKTRTQLCSLIWFILTYSFILLFVYCYGFCSYCACVCSRMHVHMCEGDLR